MENGINYYPILIGAVALGGLIISIWGWSVLQRSQKKKAWPTVDGEITQCESTSELNDLLPHIVFKYRVNDQDYEQAFIFPEGTHPLPEFTQSYINKYPVGQQVQVFYNPEDPKDATFEPAAQGDWMILVMGIMMFIGGIAAFFIS